MRKLVENLEKFKDKLADTLDPLKNMPRLKFI